MQSESFKRYVWVQGERKRQLNRDKYDAKRKRMLDNQLADDDDEPTKRTKYVWPGEFEQQLKKREKKKKLFDKKKNNNYDNFDVASVSSISSPAIEEPDDEEEHVSESDSPRRQPIHRETKQNDESDNDHIKHFVKQYPIVSDDFLDAPKPLAPASNSFFLVSSNLIDE